MRLAPQIQKTHRLPEPEKKSAGFLNLREITNPDDGEYNFPPKSRRLGDSYRVPSKRADSKWGQKNESIFCPHLLSAKSSEVIPLFHIPAPWTAAACCRFSEAAMLPPKSPGHRGSPSAGANAGAPRRGIPLKRSTASRLACRKRQQATAVQGTHAGLRISQRREHSPHPLPE